MAGRWLGRDARRLVVAAPHRFWTSRADWRVTLHTSLRDSKAPARFRIGHSAATCSFSVIGGCLRLCRIHSRLKQRQDRSGRFILLPLPSVLSRGALPVFGGHP